MSHSWGHVVALARCARRAFPVMSYSNARCRDLTAAFEAVVTPMIAEYADPADRAYLHDQLLSWGIKGSYLMENYVRLVGSPPRPDVSILAGVFTRLYDDALDEFDDDTVGARLSALFAGGDLEPRTTVEHLLAAVYRGLAERSPEATHPAAYRVLTELHDSQLESLKQSGSALTDQQVWDLALAKGGRGVVVLCSLLVPGISAADEELLHDLGALLQVVDDYQDAADDRRSGLRTTCTDGGVSVWFLLEWMRGIESRMAAAYGVAPTRPFFDSLYLWLYTIVGVRLLRRGPVRRSWSRQVPKVIPMRVILLRRDVLR